MLPKLGPFLQTSHVAAIAELLHTYLQGARLARAHAKTPIRSRISGVEVLVRQHECWPPDFSVRIYVKARKIALEPRCRLGIGE